MPNQRTPRPSMNSVAARLPEEQAQRLASTSQPWQNTPRRQSINDMAVDRIARAMKSRFERERMPDWDDPRKYSPELLAKMLGESICAGDPVGVAVMAARLFARRLDQHFIAEHAMRAFLHGSRDAMALRVDQLEKTVKDLRATAASEATQ